MKPTPDGFLFFMNIILGLPDRVAFIEPTNAHRKHFRIHDFQPKQKLVFVNFEERKSTLQKNVDYVRNLRCTWNK